MIPRTSFSLSHSAHVIVVYPIHIDPIVRCQLQFWNYMQPIVLETDIYNNINIILFQQKKFHIHNGRRMTVIDKIIQIKYLPSQPLRMAGFC